MIKNLYDLKLCEMTSLGSNDMIRRVPGGWVYRDMRLNRLRYPVWALFMHGVIALFMGIYTAHIAKTL